MKELYRSGCCCIPPSPRLPNTSPGEEQTNDDNGERRGARRRCASSFFRRIYLILRLLLFLLTILRVLLLFFGSLLLFGCRSIKYQLNVRMYRYYNTLSVEGHSFARLLGECIRPFVLFSSFFRSLSLLRVSKRLKRNRCTVAGYSRAS